MIKGIHTRGLSLALLCASAPAFAQNASSEITEIVVTAQKREQSINDVGMSITAASGEELTQRGVVNTADLAKVVPGFVYTESQQNTPVYSIRGIGFNETSLAAAPAVTVYNDEVVLPFPVMTTGAGLDVERVEVLKGPQGTLFGQNSTGGAVNYVASKPTDEFHAGVTASYGRFDTRDVQGFVSGPATDKIQMRAAGRAVVSGPWQKSYTRDAKNGKTEQYLGRFIVDWEPSDSTKFSLTANGFIDKSDPQAVQLNAISPQRPATASPEMTNYPPAPHNARAADWSPGFPRRDTDFYQLALRGDIDLTDSVRLTSLTSYAKYTNDSGSDVDSLTLHSADLALKGNIKSFGQELRLSGDVGSLNWMVGGNYQRDKVFDSWVAFVEDVSTSPVFPGSTPPLISASSFSQQNMKTYSAFANLEYEILEGLKVQGAVRYTDARRDFEGCTGSDEGTARTIEFLQQLFNSLIFGVPSFVPITPGTCATTTGLGASAATSFIPTLVTDDLNEDNISWKGGLSYQGTRDLLVYGNISRGYKAGSFPTTSASTVAQYLPVTQEALTAYEIGVKVLIPNAKTQLNAATFFYDYKDKQFLGYISDPVFGVLNGLVNVPKGEVYGFEANITTRPIEGLTTNLSATYIHTEITKGGGLSASGVTLDFEGSPFPYTPKWQLMADVQYDWGIGVGGRGLTAFVGGSALHSSSTNASLDRDPLYDIKDYSTLDLRAGVRDDVDHWQLSVWGRNITNEYYWTNAVRSQDASTRAAARPVTYGVTVAKRF